MPKFTVTIPLVIQLEVEADDVQRAVSMMSAAFDSNLSNDPLEGVKFTPNSTRPDIVAVIKTAEYRPHEFSPLQGRKV